MYSICAFYKKDSTAGAKDGFSHHKFLKIIGKSKH